MEYIGIPMMASAFFWMITSDLADFLSVMLSTDGVLQFIKEFMNSKCLDKNTAMRT